MLRKILRDSQNKEKRFVLVFWKEEQAVSVIPEDKVVDPQPPDVGDDCLVKVASKRHKGQVAAIGKQSEMEELEEKYELGEWLPFQATTTTSVPGDTENLPTPSRKKGATKKRPRGKENNSDGAAKKRIRVGENTTGGTTKLVTKKGSKQTSKAGSANRNKKPKPCGNIIHIEPFTAADPATSSPLLSHSKSPPPSSRSKSPPPSSRSKSPPPSSRSSPRLPHRDPSPHHPHRDPSPRQPHRDPSPRLPHLAPSPRHHYHRPKFSSITFYSKTPTPSLSENSSISPTKPEHAESDSLLLEMEFAELAEKFSVLDKKIEDVISNYQLMQQTQAMMMNTQRMLLSRVVALERQVSAHAAPQRMPTGLERPPPSESWYLENDYSPQQSVMHTPQPHHSSSTPQIQASQESPQPLVYRQQANAMSSSEINHSRLLPVAEVLAKYPKLHCESKIGTLAVKLVREAIFGDSVLLKCTVAGERSYPALPTYELKKILFKQFPQYWSAKHKYENLWRVCADSIGQACKRLRLRKTGQT